MKKGFTLIEILGVIVILGIILIITIPIINNVIKNSKEKAYNEQIQTIEKAGQTYMTQNSLELPTAEESHACIGIKTLQKQGFLSKKDILNPKNPRKTFNGFVKVKWDGNKYTYKYVEKCS